MTLQEYYDALRSFDWFYEYSDDGNTWRRGKEAEAKIVAGSKTSPEHYALYQAFYDYHFTGPKWAGKHYRPEQPPYPTRPDV